MLYTLRMGAQPLSPPQTDSHRAEGQFVGDSLKMFIFKPDICQKQSRNPRSMKLTANFGQGNVVHLKKIAYVHGKMGKKEIFISGEIPEYSLLCLA